MVGLRQLVHITNNWNINTSPLEIAAERYRLISADQSVVPKILMTLKDLKSVLTFQFPGTLW